LDRLRNEPATPVEQTIDHGFEVIRGELALQGSSVLHAIVMVRASNMRPDSAILGFDMNGPLEGAEVLARLLETAEQLAHSLGIPLVVADVDV
jgi:hypothetical protein